MLPCLEKEFVFRTPLDIMDAHLSDMSPDLVNSGCKPPLRQDAIATSLQKKKLSGFANLTKEATKLFCVTMIVSCTSL